MRASILSVLQTVVLTTVLTGPVATFFPLYAQVGHAPGPMPPGAFSESPFPVGTPLLLADREMPGAADPKTRPPAIQDWPEPEWEETYDESAREEKPSQSGKTSWFSFFKKPSGKKKEVLPDDGLEVVEWMNAERNFSEKDYVESAVKDEKTAKIDFYGRGMRAENEGDLDAAMRFYNAFIKANGKQTENGTLAAPYHRLALIAWKGRQNKEADVYFRYGMKYAQGGNLSIIAGDYALFLMERGETAKAEIMLRNALSYSPDDRRLLVYLGRCTTRQDRPVQALRYFTAALGEEQAYVEMAHEYRKAGEWETALRIDEKRNEFIAQRQKREFPTRPYDDRSRIPYPMPQTVSAPQTVMRPGPVAIPSVSSRPATVTPVAMFYGPVPPPIVPTVTATPMPKHNPPIQPLPPLTVSGPPASPVGEQPALFQHKMYQVAGGTMTPVTPTETRPLPAVLAPLPAAEATESDVPVLNQGWQPYVPLSGVYRYPANSRLPVFMEHGMSYGGNHGRSEQTAARPGTVLR